MIPSMEVTGDVGGSIQASWRRLNRPVRTSSEATDPGLMTCHGLQECLIESGVCLACLVSRLTCRPVDCSVLASKYSR